MIKEEREGFSRCLSFLPSCHPPEGPRSSLPSAFLVLGTRTTTAMPDDGPGRGEINK